MELILQNNLPHQQLPVQAVGDALKEISWQSPKDFYANPLLSWTNRYQSDPAFNPDCIVLFGYSFGHNAMDMLEKNKPTINLVKDKNIIIDVRY